MENGAVFEHQIGKLSYFFFCVEIRSTPDKTASVPKACTQPKGSSSTKYAKIMVETGPTLPIMAVLPGPILLIPAEIKKGGGIVAMAAIQPV